MMKLKLNCRDRSNRVQSMTKTRHNNNMIDCLSVVHAKNYTKQLGLIEPGVICDENLKRQRREQLYRCDLHHKLY